MGFFRRTGAGGLDGEVGYAGAVDLAGGDTRGAAHLAGFWEGSFEGLLAGGRGGGCLFWFKLVGEVSCTSVQWCRWLVAGVGMVLLTSELNRGCCC